MGPGTWTLVVIGAFAAILVAAGLWNKDTKGAFAIVVGLIAIAAALLVVSGCAVSPERAPWLEAGFAYDTQSTVGGNPACVVRLRAPLGSYFPESWGIQPDWLIASYVHHSSCPDVRDRNTVDQIEVVAKIPLGRTP